MRAVSRQRRLGEASDLHVEGDYLEAGAPELVRHVVRGVLPPARWVRPRLRMCQMRPLIISHRRPRSTEAAGVRLDGG